MVNQPNTKYIVKWEYDLDGATITLEEGCIIEFDGGSFSNGTVVGNETIIIYTEDLETEFNVTKSGTFIYKVSFIPNKEDLDFNTKGQLEFANREYDTEYPDGMGYVILRKDKTFAEQIADKPNTIFEIRYDFDLDGEEVSIPNNCVLRFNGGSISNGTIILQNTQITGTYFAIKCNIIGTHQGSFNLGYLELKSDDISYDNGPIINKANGFKNIFIPNGNYYFKTPIVLEDVNNFITNATFVYNGTNNKISTFTFKRALSASIILYGHIKCLSEVIDYNTYDYGIDATHGLIGLTFESIKSSRIFVSSVEGFNENVRISATDNTQQYFYNSNNVYEFLLLRNANIGIRIYQDNGGYCNQNKIIAPHFLKDGNLIINKYMAMLIAGPKFEEPLNISDTIDSVNCITLSQSNVESYDGQAYCIYARNVMNCTLDNIRGEVNSTIVYFDGDCQQNKINLQYSKSTTKIYESNGFRYPLKFETPILIKEIRPLDNIHQSVMSGSYQTYVSDGFNLANKGELDRNYAVLSAPTQDGYNFVNLFPSVKIDTTQCKDFKLITDKTGDRIRVLYTHYSGTPNQLQSNISVQLLDGYYVNSNVTVKEMFIHVPNDVTEIEVFFGAVKESAKIYANMNVDVSFTDLKRKGALNSVETHPFDGLEYYAEDLARKIIWVSDNKRWEEYDGAKAGVKRYGPTSQRPAFADIPNGFRYFDTTLEMDIIAHNNSWVDSNGRTPGKHSGELADLPNFISGTAGANDDGYQFTFTDDATYGNKTVWWNTNAGGWVDATGTVVIPIP